MLIQFLITNHEELMKYHLSQNTNYIENDKSFRLHQIRRFLRILFLDSVSKTGYNSALKPTSLV